MKRKGNRKRRCVFCLIGAFTKWTIRFAIADHAKEVHASERIFSAKIAVSSAIVNRTILAEISFVFYLTPNM